MLIWFAVMSVVVTSAVFQSPALDYRVVAFGAVLPVVEVPFGAGPVHSLLFPTSVLVAVMLATRGRRLVRRRWLGLPIGLYLHLVLDLAFTDAQVFWWPFLGTATFQRVSFEVARGWWNVGLEFVALGVGAWAWGRFGLDDPQRRRTFLTSGRLEVATGSAAGGGNGANSV